MPEVLIDRGHFDSVGDYQNPDELYDELISKGKIPEDYQPKNVTDLKLP